MFMEMNEVLWRSAYWVRKKPVSFKNIQFRSVQLLSCVRLFATPRTTAHEVFLSITNVIPFSSCPLSFPASRSFQKSQLFASGVQSIGVSASTSVLPINTQDWSPLGWTGWISLRSKGLSRVFYNTTVQKHQLGAQLSL